MRLPVAFHNSENYGTLIGEPVQFGRPFFGRSEEYESVIPKVRKSYNELLEKSKRNLKEALDDFLKEVSSYAIVGYDFILCLSKDLGKEPMEIVKVLLSSIYIKDRLSYIKQNLKKKKENPLEYAESFGELVSLLGTRNAYNLLRKNGIKISDTTLNYLYKVSMMPSSVKALIESRKLLLTVAFELPMENIEEAAEKVVGLSFNEARKILKQFQE
ncbi:MAG: hypothetical protein QXS66_08595 [Thermoproteota archaeon]